VKTFFTTNGTAEIKQRYYARHHGTTRLMLRIDHPAPSYECTEAREDQSWIQVLKEDPAIGKHSGRKPVLLVSDYGKGTVTRDSIQKWQTLYRNWSRNEFSVVVDPSKNTAPENISGVFAVTPNQHQMQSIAEKGGFGHFPLEAQAGALVNDYGIKNVIVTLSEKGVLWTCRELQKWIPASPVRNPVDVVGAGDVFAAWIAACVHVEGECGTRTMQKWITAANKLAGWSVNHLGAYQYTPASIVRGLQNDLG